MAARNVVVDHWNSGTDGALSMENMMKKLKGQGYQCLQYTFTPGTNFPDHTHSENKKDAVVTGTFQVGMWGQTVILKAGDTIEIPSGALHNAAVVGNDTVEFVDASK